MVVADSTVKGAGVPPKATRVAPLKPGTGEVTTVVPPWTGPAVVDSEVTAGGAW